MVEKKTITKCPCVIVCAISSTTEHGCVSEPLKMRVIAVHTTVKLRSGNMVTILNMSRFAMSNSIAWAIHFIPLFSWHNSSFHFLLAPFLSTLSVLESVFSHLWNSCSMPHTWMLNEPFHISFQSLLSHLLLCFSFALFSQIRAFHCIFENTGRLKKIIPERAAYCPVEKSWFVMSETSLLHVWLSSLPTWYFFSPVKHEYHGYNK